MSDQTDSTTSAQTSKAATGAPRWHTMSVEEVTDRLVVDAGRGLEEQEVGRRRDEHGPNELDEERSTPLWRRIWALATEPMTIVLVVAAAVSALVSGEVKTPVAILVVVVFNATLNLLQERRAESSLDALRQMTVTRARVRRGGRVREVEAADLVPGDVVLLEAGDVVPADGRVLQETGLEAQESALTGESTPVAKNAPPVPDLDAPLGDREDMVFMNTEVTRGSGAIVVTATGMATEMGRVAGLLESAGQGETPLQRRIGQLAKVLSLIALTVVAIVVVLGLARGLPFEDVLLTGVSLAVATIPEGLAAVVAFTLAMGANRLARRGAILKGLSSVETLGSTRHVATDKTGTLTLNQMTARRLVALGRVFEVTGEGYEREGEVRAQDDGTRPGGTAGEARSPADLTPVMLAAALAGDAVVHDGELVGDPTEGALVVLAQKAGLDVDDSRGRWPRAAVVPFDSARKYMATLHRLGDAAPAGGDGSEAPEAHLPLRAEGAASVLFVKGAPDVLARRSDRVLTEDGPVELTGELHDDLARLQRELSDEGLRVLAVACRDYDDSELDVATAAGMEPEELDEHVQGLVLLGLVGIVDPPRPEVVEAIAEARAAGIDVHMITGDHVGTASAIARELHIEGEAVDGAELDRLDDDELTRRAGGLGVLARVSPEHKIRMVHALQADGSVVAMTGDGVNDAPALKQADIGIAMGITGTEVSKGAARMVLTDDNFATIVAVVREGRGIYDNIVKFVRFQIATSLGFVVIFLVASLFGIAGGAPFTALQILWVNVIMDGPPAMALGLDRPDAGVMRRPPRPVGERILTRPRLLRIAMAAAVMGGGVLGLLLLVPDDPSAVTTGTEVATLAFTTYVLFQVFNLLNVRSSETSVFSRRTLSNRWLWVSLAAVLTLQVAVVHAPVLQGLFDTVALDARQWLVAVVVASSVLWVEELGKLVRRRLRA